MASTEQQHRFERNCDTALGWIARLRAEDVSEDDRQRFALWLAADAEHGRAMDVMLDMWDDLGSLRHLPTDTADSKTRRRWLISSFAVAASLFFVFLLLPQLQQDISPEIYQTALGERLSIDLEDGSRVTLNTASRIAVEYGRQQRSVELLRGEVFFEVAKDSARPFQVDVGDVRVTAIGTAFNIYRRDVNSQITVTEGVVRVAQSQASGSRAAAEEILHAQQQLDVAGSELLSARVVATEPYTAWQSGKLIADAMTLPALLAQLQRYHDTRIIIADPALAEMTVSGVFELEQPEQILRALELSHNIQVQQVGDKVLQLLRTPQ